MLFVTGDLHGSPENRLSPDRFPASFGLTRENFVIVLGDFGVVTDFRGENEKEKALLNWLNQLPYRILFIDGNHDNPDRLKEYPEKEWNGGIVHEIRPNVLHLTRGCLFHLDGRSIFTFGGGKSHHLGEVVLDPIRDLDRILRLRKDPSARFRVNHVNWWEEELPSREEMDRGIESLRANQYQADLILTHSPSSGMLDALDPAYEHDVLTDWLETEIRQKVRYDGWYCGHMHRSALVGQKDHIVSAELVRVF